MTITRNEYHSNYVWYACYGSNINYDRFMKYINKCTDTSKPVEDRPYIFPYNIYFAKYTSRWDGAKAFLDDTTAGSAYGRIYKVTMEQYNQIKLQEGRDYTQKIHLGLIDGIAVYSFTDTERNNEVAMPSPAYFETILNGLKECYKDILNDSKITQYLISSIMPYNCFIVASIIKKNLHHLTLDEIVHSTNLSHDEVYMSINWLVEHQVIKQDSPHHSITDEQAYLDTVDSVTGGDLIQSMMNSIGVF